MSFFGVWIGQMRASNIVVVFVDDGHDLCCSEVYLSGSSCVVHEQIGKCLEGVFRLSCGGRVAQLVEFYKVAKDR